MAVSVGMAKNGKKWEWGVAFEDRFEKALATGFRTDLKIILNNHETKTTLNVHKIFLQLGSSVLDEKIRSAGSTNTRKNGNQLIFEIENIDPDIFKTMIKHFYTGKSGADLNQALRLLQLASEFEVKELVEECENLLKGEFKRENVLPLFEEGMLHAHQPTIKRTLDFICSNGTYFLMLKEFSNLRLECLIEIIKQDELKVEDEMEVFEAVYRWGEAECTRKSLDLYDPPVMRRILEKALKYIRFPLMKSEEFVLKVGTKNLLGMEEQMALLMCFLVPPEKRSVLPEGRFISTPRNTEPNLGCNELKSPQPKIYTISREHGSSLVFSAPSQTLLKTENIRLHSSTTFALLGLRFHKNSFKAVNASNPQQDPHYSFSSIKIHVELKFGRGLQTINMTCSPVSSENYLVINFAKDEQISVKPSERIELKISFSGNVLYGSHPYEVHQFLRAANNYGSNGLQIGQHSFTFISEGKTSSFVITKTEMGSIDIGFVNAFIVSS